MKKGRDRVIGTTSFSEDGVFLKQTLDGVDYFYKVVQADDERLVTIFLDRGGILGFQRIK